MMIFILEKIEWINAYSQFSPIVSIYHALIFSTNFVPLVKQFLNKRNSRRDRNWPKVKTEDFKNPILSWELISWLGIDHINLGLKSPHWKHVGCFLQVTGFFRVIYQPERGREALAIFVKTLFWAHLGGQIRVCQSFHCCWLACFISESKNWRKTFFFFCKMIHSLKLFLDMQ